MYLTVLVLLTSVGIELGESRIAGGQPAEGEAPWMVSVQYGSYPYIGHNCGGALVSGSAVLTTAFCINGLLVLMRVRVGSKYHAEGGQYSRVLRFVVHPDYNLRPRDSDLAILHLVEPITVATAAPIALPTQDQIFAEGTLTSLAGWGAQQGGGHLSPVLLRTEVPITSHAHCKEFNSYFIPVTENMICAGAPNTGGCLGDFGGPLVLEASPPATPLLVGIFSWGFCGQQILNPDVFVPVAKFRDWIDANL